ncbi:MAG: MFS transporter [Cloacibacillus sp.]
MTDNFGDIRRAYKYILIFFLITFISASLESGYYFLLPYLEGSGIAAGLLGGAAMGVCYGVSFVIRPFIPAVEQRIGDEWMLRCGYICFFISAAGVAAAAVSINQVIFWRGLAGLGLSMVGVSLTAYEREFIPEHIRGYSIALITTAYSLPSLVVVPPMEYLIGHGFFKTYIFFFPLLVAVGFWAVLRLPGIKGGGAQENEEKALSYAALLKEPKIQLFALSAALFALTDAGQLTFVQLAKEIGMAASYFFSVSAATALIFRIFCGRLIDLLPRKICASGACALTAAMMFTMTFASTPAALMICGFLFGVGMGFGYPAFMCMTLDLGGRKNVTRLAVIFGLIYSGLFFLTPVAMEFLIKLTGGAGPAYRLLYLSVFVISSALVPVSARVYRSN